MTAANKRPKPPLQLLLDLSSSYGLACLVLLLLFVLTFLGTIEQTKLGLFDVQKKYFESVFLVHWLWDTVPIPLPGGYLLMIVLAFNLIMGGVVRIRKQRATAGVIIGHLGILLLLLAGLVKLKLSDDGHMTLYEEGRAPASYTRSDEYQSYHEWELAVWDASQSKDVVEHLIDGSEFLDLSAGSTRTFRSEELPFSLELTRVLRNCQALPKGPMWTPTLPVVDGYALRESELAKENEQNVAGVYVTIHPEGGDEERAILHGHQRAPLVVSAGDKVWAVDLRKKRFKLPFTIVLNKFTRELHPRTNSPKVFKSEVSMLQEGMPETPVNIEMNEPLRHRGFTLFQASWGPGDAKPGDPLFSTFAVVRNPSDYWPLYACIVIAAGLLLAFTEKLIKYVKSQAAKRAKLAKSKEEGK